MDIVGLNGGSILANVAYLCNVEAFKVLMDNDFKYINQSHLPVIKILKMESLENE